MCNGSGLINRSPSSYKEPGPTCYCTNCGHVFDTPFCPDCGATVEPKPERYCSKCGRQSPGEYCEHDGKKTVLGQSTYRPPIPDLYAADALYWHGPKCPTCGNSPGGKNPNEFCSSCGTHLIEETDEYSVCGKCGHHGGRRYCQRCGGTMVKYRPMTRPFRKQIRKPFRYIDMEDFIAHVAVGGAIGGLGGGFLLT